MVNESKPANWIGLDIGGANLKVADAQGNGLSHFFPLWQKRDELALAIRELISEFGIDSHHFAMTMTGELADCYHTKQEGVAHIIDSTLTAIGNADLRIATVDDRWLAPVDAKQATNLVAAANWRLTARYVASNFFNADQKTLLIDVGSTTTDLIPIDSVRIVAQGSTDTERLQTGELVYCGVWRTSVDSLVSELPYRNGRCPIMRERFATTADAWLMLGELEEDSSRIETADGMPFTIDHSIDRLAKLIGADRTTFTLNDAKQVAKEVADKQIHLIAQAIRSNGNWPFDNYYLTGEGEFVAKLVVDSLEANARVIRASESVSFNGSSCCPAFAAAWLASREIAK